jgi:ornithine carbamoyltransferase
VHNYQTHNHFAVAASSKSPKHILSSSDLDAGDIRIILDTAKELKVWRRSHTAVWPQDGLLLSMIFEKQSLRTRVSFETAFRELGGHATYLTPADIGPGTRETMADIAQVLSTWSTLIVARLKSHNALIDLASASGVPVINALTDEEHPCQALADLMTIEESFGTHPLRLVYIGDGNNVANSFAITASLLGHEVIVCCPEGYKPSAKAMAQPNVSVITDPAKAVQDAHAVYTDVWVSMGQEDEEDVRTALFSPYQVNADLMANALPEAIFMHCLPAKRGVEVTDEVIDSTASVVFRQAENRLHAQKSLMKLLMQGILN